MLLRWPSGELRVSAQAVHVCRRKPLGAGGVSGTLVAMRMLFASTAGAGHFGPMVPVAHALVAAGHEVRVAAPESFADHVARAGLEHVPFDDVPPEVMGAVFARIPSMTPEEANATVVREVFGRLDARAAYPRVQQVVDDWAPDVILREPCEFGSLAAAERSGVPHAEVAIGVGRVRAWAGEYLVEPLLEARRDGRTRVRHVHSRVDDSAGAQAPSRRRSKATRGHRRARPRSAIAPDRSRLVRARSRRRGATATSRSSTSPSGRSRAGSMT